jgi:uncharacterized protein (TIGR02453 family)
MKRFQGFADADATFFKSAREEPRACEWFQSRTKEELEVGWNAAHEAILLADLRAADRRKAYAHCDLDEPKVFRIFRDVRFSKDKSPYKTFVAGCLPMKRTAKITELPVAVYMHFGSENLVASGLYTMDAPVLARYRSAVADDTRGKELAKILAKLEKAGFSAARMSADVLKKVPKGFDPEHPRAELLKRKSLGVAFPPLPKGALASADLLPWLVTHAKKAVPLVEWLVFATA